jgi:hypothetical protein
MLSRAQQGAIEQDRCGARGRGHAGWYADALISGNGSVLRAGL